MASFYVFPRTDNLEELARDAASAYEGEVETKEVEELTVLSYTVKPQVLQLIKGFTSTRVYHKPS
jgi:hypothetical protein